MSIETHEVTYGVAFSLNLSRLLREDSKYTDFFFWGGGFRDDEHVGYLDSCFVLAFDLCGRLFG